MLEIKILNYEDLTNEEKEWQPENGPGKEYATYLRVIHNGKSIRLESDAIEPEDTIFPRDLSWIKGALQECYELGKEDCQTTHLKLMS